MIPFSFRILKFAVIMMSAWLGYFGFLISLLLLLLFLWYGIFGNPPTGTFQCAVTTNWGLNIILTQLSTNEKTAVVKYPLWIINMGFLIGGVLLVIFALWKIYDCRKYFRNDATKTE